ncbi:MAG TPA: hypothetical protein VGD29_01340 [Actinoplanes sp.]|jgi:hypothetical protein
MTGAVDLRALFFDDPSEAAEAMATAVLGQPGGDMAGVVRAMPEAVRKAALTRVTDAATGLLEQDVTAVFCNGWQKHNDIRAAAWASLADPETTRRVGLATHAISLKHEPSVELRLGGQTLATVALRVQLEVLVKSLQAVVRTGRLVGVDAGTCDIDGSLAIGGRVVARRQVSLLLPLTVQLGRGWLLVDPD